MLIFIFISKISSSSASRKISGHFIDYHYDTGPILLQQEIDIEEGEKPLNIAKKVLNIEHELYIKSIKLFCDNKIYWKNNKPLIKE